jgi:hypothetical protein
MYLQELRNVVPANDPVFYIHSGNYRVVALLETLKTNLLLFPSWKKALSESEHIKGVTKIVDLLNDFKAHLLIF